MSNIPQRIMGDFHLRLTSNQKGTTTLGYELVSQSVNFGQVVKSPPANLRITKQFSFQPIIHLHLPLFYFLFGKRLFPFQPRKTFLEQFFLEENYLKDRLSKMKFWFRKIVFIQSRKRKKMEQLGNERTKGRKKGVKGKKEQLRWLMS